MDASTSACENLFLSASRKDRRYASSRLPSVGSMRDRALFIKCPGFKVGSLVVFILNYAGGLAVSGQNRCQLLKTPILPAF